MEPLNILDPNEVFDVNNATPLGESFSVSEINDLSVGNLKSLDENNSGIKTRSIGDLGNNTYLNHSKTLTAADPNDFYLFNLNRNAVTLTKFSSSNTSYVMQFCFFDYSTGTITPTNYAYMPGASVIEISAPAGSYAWRILSTGTYGANYTLQMNNSFSYDTYVSTQSVSVSSDLSMIVRANIKNLYRNGNVPYLTYSASMTNPRMTCEYENIQVFQVLGYGNISYTSGQFGDYGYRHDNVLFLQLDPSTSGRTGENGFFNLYGTMGLEYFMRESDGQLDMNSSYVNNYAVYDISKNAIVEVVSDRSNPEWYMIGAEGRVYKRVPKKNITRTF